MGIGLLMTKITAIEAFPEHKPPTSVKPIINKPEFKRKICTNCKLKGHLAPEGWGRCTHCDRFGHKSQVCRSKPQPEPVKKTDGKKLKGKKKNKEKAKRIAELTEFVETLRQNSPDISDSKSSESDSYISEVVNRVQLQSPRADPQSRRDRRSNVYAEISDEEVINTLNRTKIASINKVKKTKSKGMSHTDGLVSNRLDFRSVKTERLLLDSGAQVNIVGETIAREAKVKIIKLRNDRFVTEASGNRLNIIGVCIFYVKLPFLRNAKKLECLVLRGAAVDREILISCETLLKWDLIHSSFGQETVTDYCSRTYNSTNYNRNLDNKVKLTKIKNVNIAQLYTKSRVPTDKLLERIPEECVLLRKKNETT